MANDGKFKPGSSGNPSGRPRNEIVALRATLAENAEAVVKVILDAAKGGDLSACKLILDRLLPALKPTAAPVHLSLADAASPLDIGRAILTATADGKLPPDIAAQLVAAVGAFCRIEEIEELRDRIAALEKATTQAKP